ncbi:MAG: prolyl oligopeptidase family serine peptidase [Nitrospirae bacterium]|nr:prolyl oligopeptidase family serine peptidase [Nitrospirota bacterium]
MPGTGENTFRLGPDGGRAYGLVIDHLVGRAEIDSSRLGVVGVSFGGYWATWLAIHEPRIRSVVNVGGPIHGAFATMSYLKLPNVLREALKASFGMRSVWGLYGITRRMSLKADLDKITVPYLVINGTEDSIVPPEDVWVVLRTGLRRDAILFPGEDHCAVGRLESDILPAVRDWFLRTLGPTDLGGKSRNSP